MHSPRRQFLAAAATLVGGSLLPVRPAGAAGNPPPAAPSLKLGLVTYNLAKDWDIGTLLNHCTAAGFDGVELRTTHRHGVEVGLSATERTEVRRRFADSPVELFGLGSAFDYHTPDADKLRRDMDATREYIRLAHDVGATGVKVRPNGLPAGVPVERTLEQIGRSLLELGRFAADHGQTLRLEVHGSGTSLLPNIRTIMDHARHPSVGVCWNSNQTDLAGDGFDANFNLVADRIVAVHLRDLFLEEYPFRQLFGSLLRAGYRGYTLAEIPESSDPVRVMRYFRALWLAYQAPG